MTRAGTMHDLIHACRSLARSRTFTFVCVATLGIGMSPVILIHYGSRMFTTPPPTVDIERPTKLVEVVTAGAGPERATSVWSYPDFLDLRGADTGVSMTGWASGQSRILLPDAGTRTQIDTMFVAPDYFATIGVTLARGQGFAQGSAEPVVVLGHAFWQRHLAGDPEVVGRILTVNGVPHAVGGVAPEHFGGHLAFQNAALFLPLDRHPAFLEDRNAWFDRSAAVVRIHGRLTPGVETTQASAAVSAVTARLAREYPATNEFRAGIVEPYFAVGSEEHRETEFGLPVLQAIAALPLLVVCMNLSGLMQMRGAMRERELTIRQAIGASRRRLMLQLLAEPVVLAVAGGTLASIAMFNLPPLVAWWVGEPIPPQMRAALTVDAGMIAFSGAICLATSLVFGWLPALRFSRPAIMTVLKDETGTGGVRASRAHRITAALQIAVSVPPLVLGFVSLERVRATAAADLGFAADHLYAAPIRSDAQLRTVRDNLSRTGGVAGVTLADGLPLDFRYRMARVSTPAQGDAAPAIVSAQVTRVGDHYFETMGISLVRGRAFADEDDASAPPVTIVSKPLADRLFREANPIGQTLTFDTSTDTGTGTGIGQTPRALTIIGVTADFPTAQMSTTREQLLLPLAQHPDILKDSVQVNDDRGGTAKLMLIARAAEAEAPAKMTAALENAIRDVNPEFDPASITTGVRLRQFSMDDFLNQFGVGAVVGGVTLLLATLGLYGAMGLMVSTRTRELAVRMTLGASRRRVVSMILLDVVKLIGPGVGAGVLITVALTRLDGGVRLSTVEPLAYAAGVGIAVLAALLSSLAPARRAASVEPMVAMRST